jgi:hypothetical protein
MIGGSQVPNVKPAARHRVVKRRVFCENPLTKVNECFGLSVRCERLPRCPVLHDIERLSVVIAALDVVAQTS